MSTLVGKKFPDISVKAIDEMGDTFSINVLKQATDNNKKSSFILVSKRLHILFVLQKFMLSKKQQQNLKKETQSLSVLHVTLQKYILHG